MNDLQNHLKMDTLHFVIKVANVNIEINTLSPSTYAYCIHYLSSEKPDIRVSVTQEDVHNLVLSSQQPSKYLNEPYLETLAVYDKIVDAMVNYGCFLMHGAVVAVGNEAYMFSAKSGTGKTTHAKQWIHNIPESYIVNGDKPLILLSNGQVFVCGTPWCGKERMGKNAIVPLKGIAFLERSESNVISQISFSQAYPYLLQNIHFPSDARIAKATLQLIRRLGDVPRYYRFLINNFAKDCFHTSYNALVGRK